MQINQHILRNTSINQTSQDCKQCKAQAPENRATKLESASWMTTPRLRKSKLQNSYESSSWLIELGLRQPKLQKPELPYKSSNWKNKPGLRKPKLPKTKPRKIKFEQKKTCIRGGVKSTCGHADEIVNFASDGETGCCNSIGLRGKIQKKKMSTKISQSNFIYAPPE